jgi:hypothetical protein
MSSLHFQVAEKALTLWTGQYVLGLVAENIEVILPIVFPSLFYDAKRHWNKYIMTFSFFCFLCLLVFTYCCDE